MPNHCSLILPVCTFSNKRYSFYVCFTLVLLLQFTTSVLDSLPFGKLATSEGRASLKEQKIYYIMSFLVGLRKYSQTYCR